jgi:hypothetical protein
VTFVVRKKGGVVFLGSMMCMVFTKRLREEPKTPQISAVLKRGWKGEGEFSPSAEGEKTWHKN